MSGSPLSLATSLEWRSMAMPASWRESICKVSHERMPFAMKRTAPPTGSSASLRSSSYASGIAKTEILRFVDPFGDHPPYSFTQIEISDPGVDDSQVVYGQNLMVTAKTTGTSSGRIVSQLSLP
jgi:hypothetical protein